METRAPYAVIGFFVLAAIVAVFGFVYWLNNTGGLGERQVYRVRFENSVSGMLTGSAVLFNGIRVGEVTDLRLNPEAPQEIIATIAVAPATPIRADTTASIDFQGLTGVAVVTLGGGTPTAPRLVSTDGRPPMIKADPMAWQNMTQAARTVLRRLDTVLAENAEPLRGTIANLNTFSEALARNSARIDGIVAGVERMTGGGAAGAPPVSYNLTAPRAFPASDRKRGQVAIPEPVALLMFDTQKLLIQPNPAEGPTFARAQWADNIPKLVQSKIIQAFENANYLEAVSRPVDGLASDYQLLLDIRSFQISTAGAPVADVELSARIMGANGKIVAMRTFRSSVPAQLTDARSAALSLDQAFGAVATDLVIWAAAAL